MNSLQEEMKKIEEQASAVKENHGGAQIQSPMPLDSWRASRAGLSRIMMTTRRKPRQLVRLKKRMISGSSHEDVREAVK